MSYMALYRKFRPQIFSDVKGQDHIVTTLKNQLKSDRVGHAYLFCGTRGTGKTTIAKIFARSVNCENSEDGNPCCECEMCKEIAAGRSMNVIEIDAASNNGVDNIREIVDEVSYSPSKGKYKVYIIDEVHMLSTGAFNALLKTLEEPPAYVIFILATTEVHKIPVTILSRCQRYDFKRISIETITDRLKELMDTENASCEEKALRYIARVADGSMRDALSLLDQCIAFHYGETLTYDKVLDILGAVDTDVFSELLRLLIKKDIIGSIDLLEQLIMQGRELNQFISEFTWYLRNLLLAKTSDHLEDVIDMSSENLNHLKEEAQMLETEQIMRFIRIFSELSDQIKYASQKRILFEMTLIKVCKPEMEQDHDSLVDRIRALEEKLEKGIVVSAKQEVPAGLGDSIPKAERPKLPDPLPRDIEWVAKNWQGLKAELEMPMKAFLKNSIPAMDTGTKNFVLKLSDQNAYAYFEREGKKEELEDAISMKLQKEFRLEIRKQSLETNDSQADGTVDLSFIAMDVEEADEPLN